MQSDYLIVLDRRIGILLAFLVRDLHEEAASKSLSNVDPVVLVLPSGGAEGEVEF